MLFVHAVCSFHWKAHESHYHVCARIRTYSQSQQLAPQGILKSLLDQGAARVLNTFFSKGLGDSGAVFHPPQRQTYCTMCSGTEIPSVAAHQVFNSINDSWDHDMHASVCEIKSEHDKGEEAGSEHAVVEPFTQRFLCEVDDEKRQFGMAVSAAVDATEDGPCCAFKDARTLCKATGWCYTHKRECPIMRADGCPCIHTVRQSVEAASVSFVRPLFSRRLCRAPERWVPERRGA